jgi:D-alanyl-D-alanine carboxypeptidase/D-alanyl-D-alanine-endopeptidase (penicillin-binding protein 4)
VTGRVLGDESFFDARRSGPGWKPSYYIDESPPLSALTVDRARYRGVVTGEPARNAALAFRDALRGAGITVSGVPAVGKAPADAFALGAVASPPIAKLVRWMNQESDNFIAELLLKQLGATSGAPGTSARGASVVRASLAAAGIPLAGVRIVDGSGLSPYNRITATTLASLLQAAWSNPVIRKAFIDSLPVAGRTGTLAARMRAPPARGRVAAKTGTTASASTLAGYVRGRFAFAVLSNGRPVNQYRARQAQDRFAGVLAGS